MAVVLSSSVDDSESPEFVGSGASVMVPVAERDVAEGLTDSDDSGDAVSEGPSKNVQSQRCNTDFVELRNYQSKSPPASL